MPNRRIRSFELTYTFAENLYIINCLALMSANALLQMHINDKVTDAAEIEKFQQQNKFVTFLIGYSSFIATFTIIAIHLHDTQRKFLAGIVAFISSAIGVKIGNYLIENGEKFVSQMKTESVKKITSLDLFNFILLCVIFEL